MLENTADNILEQIQGGFEASEYCLKIGTDFPIKPIIQTNRNRYGVVVSADKTNTGKVYIGFSRNVSSASFFICLSAGEWFSLDRFRGEIYAISDTASQNLGLGEW